MQSKEPLIVVNPAAGFGGRGIQANRLRRALDGEGLPDQWIETTRERDADVIIRENAGEGPVVVVGGDGTVRAAARELRGSRRPLGIVPLGTGNVLALRLGIPFSLRAALRTVAHGIVRRVDLGVSGEEPFLLAVGAGFDGRMIREADRELKNVLGKSAYVLGAAKNLPVRHYDFVIEVDGVRHDHHAASVFVANFGTQFGPWIFPPDADGVDGSLDVAIIQARNLEETITVLGAPLGLARKEPRGLSLYRGEQVRVSCPEPLPIQLDGDDHGDCVEFSARVQRAALAVLVPPAGEEGRGPGGWPPRLEWPPRIDWTGRRDGRKPS